jgi:protein TonB
MFGTLLASRPERSASRTVRSTVGSLVVHAGLVAGLVWATMAVGAEVAPEEEITFIEIPPETPPLPPPPPPPVAAPPVEVPTAVARGFQTLTVPDIVPPDIPLPALGVAIREADFSGRGVEGGRADGTKDAPPKDDISLAPIFTPFTVKPELRNQDEVARALQRNYPPLLRDAGIGGTTIMWFFIDEKGAVIRTQLFKASGHDALDEAAVKIASIMRFSPALNRDKAVQVWVQIPITFQSR